VNDSLSIATFIATVLNLEVNIEILNENKKRNAHAEKQEKLLEEIAGILKSKGATP